MAHCGRCKTTDESKFSPSGRKKSGQWCRACHNEYYRKRVEADREYFLKYQRKRVRDTRDKLTEIKVDKGCEQCGENHPACLDFHHRDEATKLFNISLAGSRGKKTVEQMATEIAKCSVLCSNCHRKLHWNELRLHGGKFSTRDEKRNGWDGL